MYPAREGAALGRFFGKEKKKCLFLDIGGKGQTLPSRGGGKKEKANHLGKRKGG